MTDRSNGHGSSPGRTHIATRPLAAMVYILLFGCSLFEPDRVLVVGELGDSFERSVSTPDTVAAGRTFEVAIATVGSRSCVSVASTEVTTDGLTATVTPFNYQRIKGGCDDVPWIHMHRTTLTFEVPGSARLIVRARPFGVEEVHSFERSIVVQ